MCQQRLHNFRNFIKTSTAKSILPMQNDDESCDSDADPDFVADESEDVDESNESGLVTENLATCLETIAVNLYKIGKENWKRLGARSVRADILI